MGSLFKYDAHGRKTRTYLNSHAMGTSEGDVRFLITFTGALSYRSIPE